MPPLPAASRRTVVGVGAVTLTPVLAGALAACDASDVGDLLPGGERSEGPSSAPAADPAADEALVEEAVAELAGALSLVAAVRVRHPRLREPLAGLEQAHATHLAALEGEQRGPTAPPTADAAAGLALVRRRATATQRRLADLAVRADSGQLAQLLASMSAAVAQRLVLLPRRPGAGA